MIPDQTTFAVLAMLLACVAVVNALIFKPILAVSDARARAVRDARELAASAAQKASDASEQFDRTLAGARGEVYRQMDEARRAALEKRAALMADTKREVEASLADATSRLDSQAATARAALDGEANAIAGDIVSRVLGRTA